MGSVARNARKTVATPPTMNRGSSGPYTILTSLDGLGLDLGLGFSLIAFVVRRSFGIGGISMLIFCAYGNLHQRHESIRQED